MTTIQIYDPALCCSTGVCGTDVDQQLIDFAADVDWAKQNGAQIERFNLAQQPVAFAENAVVKAFLEHAGAEGLPLILVDGALMLAGRYPKRAELTHWLNIESSASLSEQTIELIAIGAAIAAGCEPCFKFHYDKARKLGLSKENLLEAVGVGDMVKQAAGKNIVDLAKRILEPSEKPASPCCGGSASEQTSESGACCR